MLSVASVQLAGIAKRTGQGIPVGETSETLLEQLHKILAVEGFAFFGQNLDGQTYQRLTSSATPGCQHRFGLWFSPQLPDST